MKGKAVPCPVRGCSLPMVHWIIKTSRTKEAVVEDCVQLFCTVAFTTTPRSINMKYASAYYVPEPTEIYMFIDEDPSDLPENALLIVETKDQDELMSAVEPYFILGGKRE